MGLVYVSEASDNLRATIASLHGTFARKDWESDCASQLPNRWLTDCRSVHDYLVNPVRAGTEAKRLEIDLGEFREDIRDMHMAL